MNEFDPNFTVSVRRRRAWATRAVLAAWLWLICLTVAVGCSGSSDGAGDVNGDGSGFDANGDGRADLLLEISGDPELRPWKFAVSIFDQFEPNTLIQTFDPDAYSNGKAIAVGDADGDGRGDVLVQLDSVAGPREWKVFLSDGTSSTRTMDVLSLPGGDDARILAFNDIDGDGFADLLIQQQLRGVLSYYMSLSNGGEFNEPELIYAFNTEVRRPEIIALEDVNGDGTADLVLDLQSRGDHCFSVRAFLNGSFESGLENSTCWEAPTEFNVVEPSERGLGYGATSSVRKVRALGVADVTGDGRSELVFSVETKIASFSRRIEDAVPGAVNTFFSGPVAQTSWSYLGLEAGPSGSQWEAESHPIHFDDGLEKPEQRSLALTDLNNDGRADLLYESISASSVSWKVHLSRGNGAFEERSWLEVGSTTDIDLSRGTGVGVGDFNGDGRIDLLINAPAGRNGGFAELYVLPNDGTKFDPDGWRGWYQNDEQPIRIIGLERDGLTTVANDTSALLAWAGTAGSPRYTRNEFRELLTEKGFELRTGDAGPEEPLRINECELVYASADRDDLAANFAVASCVQLVGENLKLVQQMVYGGCDFANKGPLGGIGGACEIGSFKQELILDVGGVTQRLTVQGPGAGACGAVSVEFTCASLTADVVAESFNVSVGDTGVGGGLGVGVGFGGSLGFDEGVISGEIDLKGGIGLSFEFSLDAGLLIEHGKTGYVFVRDNLEVAVVSAGEAIVDVVNLVNDSGSLAVDGVAEGIFFVGDGFEVIGEGFADLAEDVGNEIADFLGL